MAIAISMVYGGRRTLRTKPMTRNDDVWTNVEQDENGFCTLQVRAKRGEGTRDEDRVTATLGRDTLEEVEEQRPAMLAMVRETIEETREMQPSENEDEDEDDDGDGDGDEGA